MADIASNFQNMAAADWILLVALTLIPLVGSFVGMSLVDRDRDWYASLTFPSWQPPGAIIGPIWFILYLSMGFASYLIVSDGKDAGRIVALVVYAASLLLNWSWAPVYFGLQQLKNAFFIIVALGQGSEKFKILELDICVIAVMALFFPINRIAGYLIIPYIIWILIASALSYQIWQLNGDTGEKAIESLTAN